MSGFTVAFKKAGFTFEDKSISFTPNQTSLKRHFLDSNGQYQCDISYFPYQEAESVAVFLAKLGVPYTKSEDNSIIQYVFEKTEGDNLAFARTILMAAKNLNLLTPYEAREAWEEFKTRYQIEQEKARESSVNPSIGFYGTGPKDSPLVTDNSLTMTV